VWRKSNPPHAQNSTIRPEVSGQTLIADEA
jgi:hypothetical protein